MPARCFALLAGPSGAVAPAVERAFDRLDRPLVIAVIGHVSAGKSTLVNALAGRDVAATGAGETTLVSWWLRHGNRRAGRGPPAPGAPPLEFPLGQRSRRATSSTRIRASRSPRGSTRRCSTASCSSTRPGCSPPPTTPAASARGSWSATQTSRAGGRRRHHLRQRRGAGRGARRRRTRRLLRRSSRSRSRADERDRGTHEGRPLLARRPARGRRARPRGSARRVAYASLAGARRWLRCSPPPASTMSR